MGRRSFFEGLKESFFKSWEEDPFSTVAILLTIIFAFGIRIWLRKKMFPANNNPPSHRVASIKKQKNPKKQDVNIVLKEINIYPVKSCGKISVSQWEVDRYGLKYDRRWMVINSENNRFETQRQNPKMALIQPVLKKKHLVLKAPGMKSIQIPISKEEQRQKPTIEVGIWKDQCRAIDEGDHIAQWLQKFLNKSNLRLVRMPDDHDRVIPSKWLPEESTTDVVSFADGFPFLMVSEESLEDLNDKLDGLTLPMNRFRPNLVVSGGGPFMEDTWKSIRIGDLVLYGVKKCTRCKMTTVDQEKGEISGPEPLTTLGTFRKGLLKGGQEVCFGQNMVHKSEGILKVNQIVQVLE